MCSALPISWRSVLSWFCHFLRGARTMWSRITRQQNETTPPCIGNTTHPTHGRVASAFNWQCPLLRLETTRRAHLSAATAAKPDRPIASWMMKNIEIDKIPWCMEGIGINSSAFKFMHGASLMVRIAMLQGNALLGEQHTLCTGFCRQYYLKDSWSRRMIMAG